MPRHRTHPGCLLGLGTGRLPLEGFISTLPYTLLDQHTFPWTKDSAFKSRTYRSQERLWASAKRAVVMWTPFRSSETAEPLHGNQQQGFAGVIWANHPRQQQTVLKIHKAFRPVGVQSSASPASSSPPLLPACLLPAAQGLSSLSRRACAQLRCSSGSNAIL